MAVEVKVNEQPQEIPFPKLMKSKVTGAIVLFITYRKGIKFNSCGIESTHYSTEWNMNNFTDYNEEITLKNKL